MSKVSINVAGLDYTGWKTATVTKSLESIAGLFELTVAEKWQGHGKPWPIAEGDECRVMIDDQVLITGYIDVRRLSYSPGEHSVSVGGRDRAGDLVDCSVLLDKWEFSNVDVLKLVQKIAAPYNIGVSLQPGLMLSKNTVPKKHSIDPGETAQSAIDTLCKLAGVLPVSDGRGNIVLTRASKERCSTALVEGTNILAASSSFDYSGRFRSYLVLGSQKGTDTVHVDENDWQGTPVVLVRGQAEDTEIRRIERNLVIRPESSITAAQAKSRAEWEATVRAARGDVVTVTVKGWTQDDGKVWPINKLVRITSPFIGIDGEMLITDTSFTLDSNGTTTTLTLKRPTSFLPEPTLKAASGSNLWKELKGGV